MFDSNFNVFQFQFYLLFLSILWLISFEKSNKSQKQNTKKKHFSFFLNEKWMQIWDGIYCSKVLCKIPKRLQVVEMNWNW